MKIAATIRIALSQKQNRIDELRVFIAGIGFAVKWRAFVVRLRWVLAARLAEASPPRL